jgi:hypothetical protein
MSRPKENNSGVNGVIDVPRKWRRFLQSLGGSAMVSPGGASCRRPGRVAVLRASADPRDKMVDVVFVVHKSRLV